MVGSENVWLKTGEGKEDRERVRDVEIWRLGGKRIHPAVGFLFFYFFLINLKKGP